MEDYNKKLELARDWYNDPTTTQKEKVLLEGLFPELKESSDEKTRNEIIAYFEYLYVSTESKEKDKELKYKNWIAWLEKHGKKDSQVILPTFTFNDILALQCCMETVEKVQEDKELYEQLQSLHNRLHDAYWLEKQDEQKPKFRIGDTIKKKSTGDIVTISMIDLKNREYRLSNTGFIPFKYEHLWELVEPKSIDKIEPKFHVGDWIACEELNTALIVNVYDDKYEVEFIDGNKGFLHIEYIDRNFHFWTIADAKDGDVLAYNDGSLTIFRYRLSGLDAGLYMSHILLTDKIEFKQTCAISNVRPATKEQRAKLEKAMADAGYEWDTEKKELKKIEQKSIEWHREDEQNLNACLGYIPDEFLRRWLTDAIHVKYDNPAGWSEEDETKLTTAKTFIRNTSLIGNDGIKETTIDWLNDLKDRVQPKQEWSKDDEKCMHICGDIISRARRCGICAQYDSNMLFKWFENLKNIRNIKDRIQSQVKQEWSEEDERKFDLLKALIEDTKADSTSYSTMSREMDELREFIEYIRHQNKLKPTEG